MFKNTGIGAATELGGKIEKSSENIKEAAKINSEGMEKFGNIIKESLITSAALIAGGLVIFGFLNSK